MNSQEKRELTDENTNLGDLEQQCGLMFARARLVVSSTGSVHGSTHALCDRNCALVEHERTWSL